jgi:hypothetical protein
MNPIPVQQTNANDLIGAPQRVKWGNLAGRRDSGSWPLARRHVPRQLTLGCSVPPRNHRFTDEFRRHQRVQVRPSGFSKTFTLLKRASTDLLAVVT